MSSASNREQIRRGRLENFMRGIKSTRVEIAAEPSSKGKKQASGRNEERETEKASECEISVVARKLLIKSALEPGVALTEMYEQLSLHPAAGKAAVNELLARGMVRVHKRAKAGRGGRPLVLEVLANGVAELATHGITPVAKLIERGGFVHDLAARTLKAWAARQADVLRLQFEVHLGAKYFDAVIYRMSGESEGFELVCSGSAEQNATAAMKAAGVEGVHVVHMLFEELALLKRTREAFRERADARTLAKLSFEMIYEYESQPWSG